MIATNKNKVIVGLPELTRISLVHQVIILRNIEPETAVSRNYYDGVFYCLSPSGVADQAVKVSVNVSTDNHISRIRIVKNFH